MSASTRLRDRLRDWRVSRDEIDARDEARLVVVRGTVPLGDLVPRHRATVSGVLRAVTYRPASDKPVLVGQLFDGTGSVDLVWIGRRTIAGIKPGVHLRASAMVSSGRTRPTMYNPSYDILAPGA